MIGLKPLSPFALLLTAAFGGGVVSTNVTPAAAQEKEEPFWAVGRPKSDTAAAMAPIPSPPLPTPKEELPTLTAPPGIQGRSVRQ